MDIYKTSYKLFNKQVRLAGSFFEPLAADLRKARINIPAEYWAALTIFVGFITFIVALPVSLIFAGLLQGGVAGFIFAFIVAVLIGAGGFLLAYFYPSIVAGERKKRIENSLAYGTLYLATLSRAGFPAPQMFKLMSEFKEYGELSKESAKISNDIEALGLDTPTALTRAINRSPSSAWTELLAGLKTAITTGGDLVSYLDEKAKGFVAEYKRRLQEFSNFLTMLIEIYITIVIVGAIFFIIISSIMTSIGAVPVELLKMVNIMVVLVGMPMLTAVFILIAKGVSPLED